MSEDDLLESIARGDSARVGRGPVFAYRPPLVDYIKSGKEWQTAATGMFAVERARDSGAYRSAPVRRHACANGIGLMMDTWPDTLLRFARHSTELSMRALDSLAA
jgi:hypothetical protein